MATEDLDRLAVQRDAALIHALATRTLPAEDVDIHHPVVTYLAAWVDWVDAGVTDDTVFELTAHKDRAAAASGWRHNRAALIAGSTVAALLVSSGAAAAVTGDPFLVARAPFEVIEKVNPFGDDDNARETLPDQAPDSADANKLLADAQRAMANGDTDEAERLVAEATAMLGDEVNPGQQNRIDKLNDHIAGGSKPGSSDGGSDSDGEPGNDPDKGPGNDPGTGKNENSQKPDKDTNDDKGPQDNDPVDKDPNGEKANDNDPVDKDPNRNAGGSNSGQDSPKGPGSDGPNRDTSPRTGNKGEKQPRDPRGGSGKSGRNDTGKSDPKSGKA